MPDRSVALRFATAIAIALTAAAGTAFAAAPEAAMPSPSYVRELLGILVPLAFMIVALLLVLRLLRRRYGMTGSGAHLSVL